MTTHDSALLSVSNLHAWYGESQILHGVTFSVQPGEVVTLVGRNGAGKTTILRSIMGLIPKLSGAVEFGSVSLSSKRPDEVARLGIGFCPEERAIFASLSVEENLMLPPMIASGGYELHEIYALFPNLKERLRSGGTNLSGGEQQMLALARIMRTGAKLFLLDEPSEGLAPVIVRQVAKTISQMKERGYTVLLVEQNLKLAQSVSDRFYVVELGNIVDHCTGSDLARDLDWLQKYLTV